MEITEIRVKLVNVKNDKLRAFCSITVDNDFVIRDLKVIEGAKGAFVAMPSRKLTDRCPRCGGKNHYRARFCNDCGARLQGERSVKFEKGSQKLHTDIAHPINSRCREVIQKKVLEVYEVEMQKSRSPDYKPMEFEVFDEEALVEESNTEMGIEGEVRATPEPVREGSDGNGRDISPPPADQGARAAENQPAGAPRGGTQRPEGGRERGRDGDRRTGQNDPGRGRFRRGGGGGGGEGRRRDDRDRDRDRGRGDQRHGNGQGHGPDRGGDRRGGPRREGGPEGIPERDRESFLPSRAPAAAAGSPSSAVEPPPPSRPREVADPEPEDNFGAGLFS